MWNKLKALIIKEMQILWLDKRSRFALIIPPIFQIFLLSHAATLEVKNISVAVYNQDTGWYSHEVIERIKGSSYFENVYEMHSPEQIEEAINRQDVIIALEFQSDFSRLLAAGEPANVQAILDGRRSNASQIVQGYFNEIFQQFSRELTKKGGLVNESPVLNVVRVWFNPNLNFIWYTVPCLLAILCMILALTISGLSIARERETGTFDQLLVAPVASWQILVGKAIPALVIGVGETTLIMLISLVIFKIPFVGSIVLFYFSMIIFIIAITGVGLFISALSKTQQQALLGGFMFTVPAVLLAGFASPVEYIHDWMRPLSYLMPSTYFLIIVKGIFLKDISVWQVLLNIWPMLLIGIFTSMAAMWAFRSRLE